MQQLIKNAMRKVILSLFISMLMGASAYALPPIEMAPADSLIDPIGGGSGSWGGGDRGLIINELRVSVVSFVDNYFVVVTVLQNLGQMDYCITNTNTGEFLDGEINALPGSYPIPISGSPGFYTISFILPDGRVFVGYFEL